MFASFNDFYFCQSKYTVPFARFFVLWVVARLWQLNVGPDRRQNVWLTTRELNTLRRPGKERARVSRKAVL